MSIISKRFQLSVIEALVPHKTFTTGANKPLLITGVDKNGNKGDYVVKLIGAERMSKEACMRELLASLVAIQMGIRVPKPVVVNISKEFVDLLKGDDSWNFASRSLGYNFGSEYIENLMVVSPAQELTSKQLPFAQTIFPFDVTIQNPDRTNEKPNMMSDGTEIVIFDHELAFSFVLDIFSNPEPWKVQQRDMEWINKHVLLPKIRRTPCDFDNFKSRLEKLDAAFWQTAKEIIPEEWLSDQFVKIQQHLVSICNNKDKFINELKMLMS
jgi:hypothetical protein